MSRLHLSLRLLIVLTGAAFAGGCGGDDATQGTASTSGGASAVPFDRAFIDAMVPHHQLATEMANAAKQEGLMQQELIEVADNIIASQQQEIDQMLSWREAWFGSTEIDRDGAAVLGLSDEAMGMVHGADDIEGAADVDGAFAAAMIPHHRGAIAMAELAEERAEHEEIKRLAEDIVSAQEGEIDVLEAHAGGHHGS